MITIILYYGEEEWDGSRDLHGILDFQDIPEQIRRVCAELPDSCN